MRLSTKSGLQARYNEFARERRNLNLYARSYWLWTGETAEDVDMKSSDLSAEQREMAKRAIANKTISRCAVCSGQGNVKVLHSHTTDQPNCTDSYSSIWEGYSFGGVRAAMLPRIDSKEIIFLDYQLCIVARLARGFIFDRILSSEVHANADCRVHR